MIECTVCGKLSPEVFEVDGVAYLCHDCNEREGVPNVPRIS